MEILFCEQCGMRIGPSDLESGRCKREDQAAWCPACTRTAAGAPSGAQRAQAVSAPAAPRTPSGVMPVTAAAAAVPRASGGRASMLAPPGEEVLHGQRRTTGQAAVLRRPPSGPVPEHARPAGTEPARARHTTGLVRRASTGRQVQDGEKKPLPGGGFGAPTARHVLGDKPASDPTMVYMVIGGVLLCFGIALVGYVLLGRGRTPKAPETPVTPPAAAGPKAAEKKAEPKLPDKPLAAPEPKARKIELPAISPADAPKNTGISPVTPVAPAASGEALAKDLPRLLALKPGKEPLLDGQLTDGCWERAELLPLVFPDGRKDRVPARSGVKVLATERALFIGARFNEDEMDKVPMTSRAHDGSVWDDDSLEIFLLPGLDSKRSYYQFIVNIAGSTYDGFAKKEDAWNPQGIQAKIYRGDQYWSVEVAMPWDVFAGSERQGLWRANFTRNRPKREGGARGMESTSWAVLNSTDNHTPERFGVLALEAFGGKLP